MSFEIYPNHQAQAYRDHHTLQFFPMVNTALAFLILVPFILGFITYGVRRLIQPPVFLDPVTVKISPEAMQQLREKGYLDPNTGKLKDSVVGLLNLEEAKS